MSQQIRTRFAPSPTGYLHIGGARTALFNWLFARHFNGKFLLRIEDTDKERSTQEAVDAILDGLKWLGLDWDEEEQYQSKHADYHRDMAKRLLESGHAYRCDCSAEELDRKRQEAMKQGKKARYDRHCRDMKPGEVDLNKPHVVRIKAPLEGTTDVFDLIRGDIAFPNEELDDFILLRTDGSPTYNFSVCLDDAFMNVSHVIRGDDHLNNTPKQVIIYQAAELPIPKFAHLPLILGEDKKRLSKRHGATSVQAYRDEGFLPHAMLNFLARLGWSHGDQEVFSIEELIEHFSLDNVGSSAGVFNKEKLDWLNSEYLNKLSIDELNRLLIQSGMPASEHMKSDAWAGLVEQLKPRSQTVLELADQAKFFLQDELEMDEAAAEKFLTSETKATLDDLRKSLDGLDTGNFSEESVKAQFQSVLEKHEIKMKKLAQPVRVALTGKTASPGIFEVAALLGKERTLARLDQALARIS